MKARAAVLVSLLVGLVTSHLSSPATVDPLIEFTYTDGHWAPDSTPEVQECGYYLLIRGTITHSGGFRPGASVRLVGDTVAAAVNLYRASFFDQRDARRARWTLRVGALDARTYQVSVAVGGSLPVRREAKLSFQQEGCAP